jgi:hypothetical protein
MTPGDPLDPLELALLTEVAEDLADPEEEDTPRARWRLRMVARTMRSGEMLMPRRSSNQILRADDRGDRRPLARWGSARSHVAS